MLSIKNIFKLNVVQSMRFCTKPRMQVNLNEKINDDLEKELYKPKDQPGKTVIKNIELPETIVEAIKTCVDDNRISQIAADGAKLNRYLFKRQPPIEQKLVYNKRKEIERNILTEAGVSRISELELSDNPTKIKQQLSYEVSRIYYHNNYNWKPIVYDEYKVWTYLFGRAAKEYAAIFTVLNEIARRDPEFKPESFFDFGAGVGTATWAAAQLWKQSLQEYFLVDSSREMNDLSELILRGGVDTKLMTLKNVFYRQFLPVSDEFKSHIVLSAFTLLDLPSMKDRIETLLTLWNKCDGYLILIENGTNAGFRLIDEAKEFLLQQATEGDSAYLFAPCPHEMPCPRISLDDGTPCNFIVSYRPLRIGDYKNEDSILYSYAVFKKGSRSDDKTIDWPRLVRPTQVRSGHTRCHMCTHRGKLEEAIITKSKHSKYTYRCARKGDWGDRLPVSIEGGEINEEILSDEDTEDTEDEKK